MRESSARRYWSAGFILGALFAAYPAAAQNVSLFISNTYVTYPYGTPTSTSQTTYDVSLQPTSCDGISNAPGNAGPMIEFEQPYNTTQASPPWPSPTYEPGTNEPVSNNCNNYLGTDAQSEISAADETYPGSLVNLCACIDHSSSVTTVDSLEFDVFKFAANTNPLDPTSAPPLRTYFLFNLGDFGDLAGAVNCNTAGCYTGDHTSIGDPCHHSACVTWDGFYNISGEYGKSNGQYGFRATVSVNQTNPTVGNINISNVAAYPSADGCTPNVGSSPGDNSNGDSTGLLQCEGNPCPCPFQTSNETPTTGDNNEFPINVDVVDVHAIQSTPTVVGKVTAVAAEPYNFLYRLSKDSLMTIQILDQYGNVVRTVVPGLPRVGEGIPSGGLTNGDFWDGRDDYGNMVSSGVYDAAFSAESTDMFGNDFAYTTGRAVALDPLQITDISVAPLTNSDTALAVLNYTLTEPATVQVDIWSPNTVFCNTAQQYDMANPAANVNCAGGQGTLEASIVQYQTARSNQITFWNGYTNVGTNSPVPLPDGNYIFAINAALQSSFSPCTSGPTFPNPCPTNGPIGVVQNSKPQIGFIPVDRGLVGISQISPATGVFGSTPPISGIPPYLFGYELSRDALVTMLVTESSSPATVVKTVVNNEIRAGGQLLVENWDGITDQGTWPSSGTYTVWLYATDTLFSSKVSTTSAEFPIDIFRIANVQTTPLLGTASAMATLSYILSEPMNITWNIYSPGTQIPSGQGNPWPPDPTCTANTPSICLNGGLSPPVFTLTGMRPGQSLITESWNGYGPNTLYVPDGQYIFSLVAQSTTTPSYYATDEIVGSITVARGQVGITSFNVIPTFPPVQGSSQTVPVPPYEVAFTLTRQSSVTINVYDTNNPPDLVRNVVSGEVDGANTLNTDFWDGRNSSGTFVSDAFYNVQMIANDVDSTLIQPSTAQQTISVNPLRIYDVTVTPMLGATSAGAQVGYQISEPMKIDLRIYQASTTFDTFGNAYCSAATTSVTYSTSSTQSDACLLYRIVGERADRQEITETWNGLDLTQSLVPDGDYPFSLIASPNAGSIDSATGNVAAGAVLAYDVIVSDIPINRGSSADPSTDFANNSIIYPDPSRVSVDPNVHFRIRVPVQATVSLNLFTLSGDKILSIGLGQFTNEGNSSSNCGESDSYCDYAWPRTNSSGRQVAPGVYFAVIREETTLGSRAVYQTVKKFLLQ